MKTTDDPGLTIEMADTVQMPTTLSLFFEQHDCVMSTIEARFG